MKKDNQKSTMKDLPLSERPCEKCEELGPESLSDKELLTVLIRSGSKYIRADEIALCILEMCKDDGIAGLLGLSVNDLAGIPGIGKVKAVQIAAAVELAKRISSTKKPWGNKFSSSKQVAEYYIPRLSEKTKEQLHLLILDTKNRVIKDEVISIGNINSSICDPREIFSSALKNNGVSIILLHNHPSGDPSPSQEDLSITERILKTGVNIGINLLDHIIIGRDSFVSMKDDGFLTF